MYAYHQMNDNTTKTIYINKKYKLSDGTIKEYKITEYVRSNNPGGPLKLSNIQRAEIWTKYIAGVTMKALADERCDICNYISIYKENATNSIGYIYTDDTLRTKFWTEES